MLNAKENREKIMKLLEDLRSVIDRIKELDKDLIFDDKDNNNHLGEYSLSALTILSQELNLTIDEIWELKK